MGGSGRVSPSVWTCLSQALGAAWPEVQGAYGLCWLGALPCGGLWTLCRYVTHDGVECGDLNPPFEVGCGALSNAVAAGMTLCSFSDVTVRLGFR